jgi:hypothetical protein
VFQKEQAETGTTHYQGYAEFKSPLKTTACQKIVKGAWFYRRGTRAQAREYCMKEDTRVEGPFEAGKWELKPGKRNDLINACELVKQSRSLRELADELPQVYVKYHKGFHALLAATVETRGDAAPECILLYGPTGTGKSHWAFHQHPDAYWKPPMCKWFPNYLDHPTVIMDEFAGRMSKYSLTALLRLIDRYPMQVETKGGFVPLNATKFVFTTNIHPKDWYDFTNRKSQYNALARRFTTVYWCRDQDRGPEELVPDSFFEYTGLYPEDDPVNGYIVKDEVTPSYFDSIDSDDIELLEVCQFPEVPRPPLKRTRPQRVGDADPDEPLFGQKRRKIVVPSLTDSDE